MKAEMRVLRVQNFLFAMETVTKSEFIDCIEDDPNSIGYGECYQTLLLTVT